MKKYTYLLFCIAILIPAAAYAKVSCLFKDSTSVSTPNRHCSKHCGRHADNQPVETLKINLSKEWRDKGAFYKNATARCEGGNGCGYISVGKPRTFNSGKSVDVSYKTWSIPVKIVVEADVCIIE